MEAKGQHTYWARSLASRDERRAGSQGQNQAKPADNGQLEYDLDRFITDNWFGRVGAEQNEDEFAFFTRQRSLGTGPGYRFWDNELGRLDVVGQLNRLQLKTRDTELALNTYSLAWDFKRLLWGTRLEFYSTAEVQLPDIEQIDYVRDSEIGLRSRLNDWARLSLLYELDQVRGLGQSSSERRYLLGVGVGW